MKRFIYAALVATGLSAFAFCALAQPGPHGGALFGNPMAVLQQVKAQLNLNTGQQQQWDNAVVQTQMARDSARASFGQLKAAMQAELAKPAPDLAAVAVLADSIQQQNSALRRQARDAWLALYGTFDANQKAVVRDAISARMAKMEAFRQKIRERLDD